MKILSMTFLLLILLSPLTLANQPTPRHYGPKTKVFNFESDTITGDVAQDDRMYIEARKKLKHQSLIKLRQHWKDKIRNSVHDL